MSDGAAANDEMPADWRSRIGNLLHRLTTMPTRLLLGSALLLTVWLGWLSAAFAVLGQDELNTGFAVYSSADRMFDPVGIREVSQGLRQVFAPISRSGLPLFLSVMILATVGGPLRWRRSIFVSSVFIIAVAIPSAWPSTRGRDFPSVAGHFVQIAGYFLTAATAGIVALREIRAFGLSDRVSDGSGGEDA